MSVNQNDVMEVSARSEWNGVEDTVSVYQLRKTDSGPTDDADVVDDLVTIMELIYNIFLAAQTALLIYRDIRIKNVTQDVLMGVHPWPTITAGVATGGAMPPGNAALVSFDTGKPRVVLRKFLGGLVSTDLDADGTLDTAVVAALLVFGATLVAPLVQTNGTYEYGYLSPKTLQWETPISVVVTDITAYQRRRKQGRGS